MHRFFTNQSAKKSTLILLTFIAVFLVVPFDTHAQSVTSAIAGFFGVADLAVGTITKIFFEVLILPFAAAMMALMGNLMDVAINFSLHTAFIFSLSPAINLGWVIVRDIANILFIFILIYISIGTIVKSSSFQTKKLLTSVIIAAILINFSMFFTKAIIDVSNVFGNWLYGGIQKTLAVNSVGNPTPGSAQAVSLSGLIADRLGILKYWVSGQSKGQGDTITSVETFRFTNIIIRLIIVLIATYVFAYCAILFMARSVELLILLIFAPIGFVGGLLPQTKKYADEWWHELGCVATFPVAFLLMLYISLQFINSLSLLENQLKTMSNPLEIGGFSVMTYFQYFIIIFLLLASLKVAKENACKVGELVGGVATGLGKFAVTSAVSLGVGASGFLARGAAKGAYDGYQKDGIKGILKGGLSGVTRSTEIMESLRNPGKLWVDTKQAAARGIKKAANERTWDMRRMGIPFGEKIGLEGSLGDVLKKQTGIDFGKTKTNKEKRQEQTKKKKENREAETDVKFREAEESLADSIDLFKQGVKTEAETIEEFKKAIGNLTDKQVGVLDEELLKNELLVRTFKPTQVDAIEDPSTKKAVKDIRIKPLADDLANVAKTVDDLRVTLASLRLKPQDIAKMDYDKIISQDKFVSILTPNVLHKMLDELTPAQISEVRRKIDASVATPEKVENQAWFTTPIGRTFK